MCGVPSSYQHTHAIFAFRTVEANYRSTLRSRRTLNEHDGGTAVPHSCRVHDPYAPQTSGHVAASGTSVR